MKSTTILSLTAALLLSTTSLSFSQAATGTVGAGVTVEDGSVSVDADADAAGSTEDASPADDGDDNEGATGEAGADAGVAQGEPATGAAETDEASPVGSDSDDCANVDMTSMASAEEIAAIAGATSIQVVRLTNCDDAAASLDAAVQTAVTGNADIAAALAQEGVGGGEVLGVSSVDGSVTVYVADDSAEGGDTGEGDAGATAQ